MSIKQPHPRPHTKAELLNTGRVKGDTTHALHDGKPRADHFVTDGTEPLTAHHPSHGSGDAIVGHAVPGNLARDGRGKRHFKVPVNGSAQPQQHFAVRMGGSPNRGESTPGVDPMMPDPLTPGKEKQLSAPQAHPSMKGASDFAAHIELGQQILKNAVRTR